MSIDARSAGVLDEWLSGAVIEGRARWPEVAPAAAELARLTAAALAAGETLERLHAADLYLAAALANGDRAALGAFEREILSAVDLFVKRVDPSPAFADEVRQVLRERLLVAAPGGSPRIAGYRGGGPLAGWVRVAAVRIAHNLKRAERSDRSSSQRDFDLVAGRELDPEMDYLRQRYGALVRDALGAALAELTAEEKSLLALHFLDGVPTERIAVMVRVHPATVRRRLARARAQVRERTRELVRERLGSETGEVTSVLRLVRSELDRSMSRLLGDRAT